MLTGWLPLMNGVGVEKKVPFPKDGVDAAQVPLEKEGVEAIQVPFEKEGVEA